MYTVSETACRVGVARSTLLYYERIRLVTPERDPVNGYRRYGEDLVVRLIALRQLQRAGLNLQECRRCLDGEMPAERIGERLRSLEAELHELLLARELLRSFAGEKGGTVRVSGTTTSPAALPKRTSSGCGDSPSVN